MCLFDNCVFLFLQLTVNHVNDLIQQVKQFLQDIRHLSPSKVTFLLQIHIVLTSDTYCAYFRYILCLLQIHIVLTSDAYCAKGTCEKLTGGRGGVEILNLRLEMR